MTKPQSNLLLFDVDGVIIDSFELVYNDIVAFIKNKGGSSITQHQFRQSFEGNALQKNLEYAGLTDMDKVTDQDLKSLVASYKLTRIFPGMHDVLMKLAQKHILVAVTSTHIDPVRERFEAFGIADFFTAYLGPKAAVHKDKKVLMAMEEFGKQTDQVYFITDTLGDMLEVKDIGGLKMIGVTWGYHERFQLELAQPLHIVDTPEELLGLTNSKRRGGKAEPAPPISAD